jgi:DNA-binding transcriptional ArsR family regulator
MKITCPKCQSPNARYDKTETDLIVKCYCGYNKVVFTTLVHTLEGPLDDNEDEDAVKMPRTGTSLHKTMMVLSILPDGNSLQVTERLNELNGLFKVRGTIILKHLLLTVSDVSSYLTILRSKGLVERTQVRRGVAGGSDWRLTEEAIDLMGLE